MAQSTDPDVILAPAEGELRKIHDQKTLLLTDVPEASALLTDAPTSLLVSTQLSSTALAALSQRYEILAEAGQGSMGNVFKARDRETGEIVALKLLKPEIASDQSMMERFKNELLFARKITHKNVCRLYEFNRINGIAFTSMEFVAGESLRSVLNRFGSLSVRKGMDLVGQICSGLKEAHAQGIVHRDLKPENVMVDTQGNVKIMDFGIARSMEAGTRLTGSMMGTPAYMAPEQVASTPVDYRTDVYSLGLILYEIFTGTPAFQADNSVAVALKQMRESPVPPHDIEPSIPVSVERAILKCLEKEPAKRFQSIGELEDALRITSTAFNASAPAKVPAHRSSQVTPISRSANPAPKPRSKHPSAVIGISVGVLIVLAAGAIGRSVQVARAAQKLDPPPALAAPKPPDFAYDIPASTLQRAETAAVAAAKDEDPPDEPLHAVSPAAKESLVPVATPTRAPVPTPPVTALASQAPFANNDMRGLGFADSALNEAPPVASPSSVAGDAQNYLWVGRFERQEPAQNAASKIEGLGLAVTVVPRHGEKGDFFVVVTGPFSTKRIPSVIEWLDAQGFHNARQIPNFLVGLKLKQNSNP